MDYLPPQVVTEILSRLTDSTDLARCRLTCKTLNETSRDVRSINLLCTLSHYLKSRSPLTKEETTPFKIIFNKLVQSLRCLNSVSIGVEKALGGMAYEDVDDADDLYLTDVAFLMEWVPRVCGELKSLSITDFWIQSCWRRSDILPLISSCCQSLNALELKNAWLSVDGLNPMPNLTSLTLEFIRLDDEDLDKFNDCFSCLQVLNLIGVGGLKEPKICLSQLKTCEWTVSNAPYSLSISAPSLVKLRLKCVKPNSLILEAPLLSDFFLSIEQAYKFEARGLVSLRNLRLESADIRSLIFSFYSNHNVRRITVDSPRCMRYTKPSNFTLEDLFYFFPFTSSLCLRSGTWSDIENTFLLGDWEYRGGMRELKELIAHLVIKDINVTFSLISFMLDICVRLSDVTLLIRHDAGPIVSSDLISRCKAAHPRIKWRWGMWKEDAEDTWISGAF